MWVGGASSERNHCISSGGIAIEMITLITHNATATLAAFIAMMTLIAAQKMYGQESMDTYFYICIW